MNTPSLRSARRWLTLSLAALALLSAPQPVIANGASVAAVVDDFTEGKRHGNERFLVDDKGAGSQSTATLQCADGVLRVKGQLVPGRGAPAFISVPLLLVADAAPQDVSAYQGIRLRVKIDVGSLSVQAASADVTNFDFHASSPIARKPGEYQEVRIPFKDLKRAWSEQTPLNAKAVTSINLVAFSMAKDAFSYEVDEVSFY